MNQQQNENEYLNERFVEETNEKTIKIEQGENINNSTYTFFYENHTLGNALRHILLQDKQVDFCGYTIPHPLTAEMKLRLQTKGDPHEILKKGLENLMDESKYILNVFDEKIASFANQRNEEENKMEEGNEIVDEMEVD